jgi:hypothetical protein
LKPKFPLNPGPLTSLIVALLLGVASVAICVWWTLADVMTAFANDKVTASVVYGQKYGPILTGRIFWFALALLLLHLAFGMLALGLTRLTSAALPQFAEGRRLLLIGGWFLVLATIVLMANATWFPASRFSPDESWLHSSWRGLRPVHAALALLSAVVVAIAWRAARRHPRPSRQLTWMSAAAVLLLFAGLVSKTAFANRPATAQFAKPHVVIIGLDSLRNDLAGLQAVERREGARGCRADQRS